MKNDYEIRGDVTVIFLDRKDGSRLECLIDTVDLERAQEFPWKWSAHWDRHTLSFYAEGKSSARKRNKDGAEGKREYFSLHRWICNPPEGHEVDHIFHDTLDNRRSVNLRVIPKGFNQQNYYGARRDSGSGVRGVAWNKDSQRWIARFRINGKMHHIGSFVDKDEAERAVISARAKYMPYSLDADIPDVPKLNEIINPCFETGLYATNTSGYRGLIYEKKTERWYGRAQRKGKTISTKSYENKEDAYKALCEKLKSLEAAVCV